tara:strand:- start:13 stop:165 length:153 start_codon:yes stop_codon:yes gene_type:complete
MKLLKNWLKWLKMVKKSKKGENGQKWQKMVIFDDFWVVFQKVQKKILILP